MNTRAALEGTLRSSRAYVAALDNANRVTTMAAQMRSTMETIGGLTELDLPTATALTQMTTGGPWAEAQQQQLPARLAARYPLSSGGRTSSRSNNA